MLYGTGGGQPPAVRDINFFRPGIDKSPQPLIATKADEGQPEISPDGKWLAYVSNESGTLQIYVIPFPNVHDGKWPVSSSGGTDAEWSHRGDELFYRDSSGKIVAAKIKTTPVPSVGSVTTLFSAVAFQFGFPFRNYAVSPDDRRFLMIRRAREPAEHFVVVENWFDELKPSHTSGSTR